MCAAILATARPLSGTILLDEYFPSSQLWSAVIACLPNSLNAIFWAEWLDVQAIGTAVFVLSGKLLTNCKTCIPPIEPPTTEKSFLISKWSNKFTWALTISLIVITGKSVPYIFFVSGLIWLGPNEPIHPPMTFAQMIKYLLVSIDLLGPTA